MTWQAEFADGQTAIMRAVLVRLEPGALVVEGAAAREPLARWPLAQTALDELQEGGVAYAQCRTQPLAQLTITDPGLLAELRHHVGRGVALPGRGNRTRFALAAVLTILALAVGLYLSIPSLSRAIAQRVPLEYERELGTQLLPFFANEYCSQPRADAALATLQRRLDPNGEVPAELHVWRSDVVNAYAMPGGIVVLSEALLQKASSPDEVAGVLAHELEHVRHRHVMSHFVRATLLAAGWSVAVGDYAGFMVIDPATAFNIMNLRFSRHDEAEADAAAALRLDRAGISRRGLHDFFQRLREQSDFIPAWLSSHPTSESRAHLLGIGVESASTPALDADAFAALQSACVEE